MWGVWCGVQGVGLSAGVEFEAKTNFKPQGAPPQVKGVECRVSGVGCGVWGVGCGVWGVGCGV